MQEFPLTSQRLKPRQNWSRIGVLSCLLLLCAGVWQPVRADVADDEYSVAAGFYQRMRWDLAAESFRTFITKYPRHEKVPSARLFLGLSLVNQKDYEGARESLRKFVRESPENKNVPHALYRIAEASYLLDDLKAAEPELSDFLKKAPDDPLAERALPYLADVQLRTNKPEAAAANFEKALRQFPQGVMAEDCRFGLARTYEVLGKTTEAIRLYEALAADPKGSRGAEALLNLGGRYYDDGNFAASAASYLKLEQQYPASPLVPVAQLNAGFAYYQAGDFRKAIERFDAAAEEAAQAPDARYWKALSLKSLNDYPAAVTAFKTAYEADPQQPLAESLLYHWADSEHRRGEYQSARQLFLDVVKRWPTGDLADDSLYLASLSALEAGQAEETAALLARFSKEFPGSGLRWHVRVLNGRLELLKKEPAAALPHLEAVLRESESETTRAWARYYLAYAQHQLGKDAEALAASEPLVSFIDQDPDQGRSFATIHVLRGTSQLMLARKAETPERKLQLATAALTSAAEYLKRVPQGDQAGQALSIRAIAAAFRGDKKTAQDALQAYKATAPNHPELEKTFYEIAEIAYSGEDWTWAESLFTELADRPKESEWHARGLSGLGWSQYRLEKYPEAAATFARVTVDHPEDELAAEAAFMRGKALEDGKRPDEAVAALQEAFTKFGDSRYAYLAGLQSARLLGELRKIDEADAAYAELLKRFPKPNELDKVLDEWALLNYAAERFERSDEIFRRLLRDVPESELADNARLSLAESDLLAGRVDQAREQFTLLQSSPKSDTQVQQAALYQLIGILHERQQWKELRDFARDLSERFPEGRYRWYAEFRRAEADLNLSEPQAAQERLMALKQKQDNPEVAGANWFPQIWILLAEAQFRQKQYSAVAATAEEFKQRLPESKLHYLVDEILGRSLKAQAMFPQAREAFARVVSDENGRLTETAAKSQFMIAESHLLEKDYQTAEKEYLKVEILYDFPEWQAPALFQAAACQEQLNRWAEAVKSYESLLKRFPDSEFAAKAKERLEVARKRAGTS